MLKHLKKVRVEFNAFDPRSSSALEFVAQCTSRKARESNPECDLFIKRRTDDAPPVVKVTYMNGVEETMDGSVMAAQHMRKRILDQAEVMETEQMFKDAGLKWPVEIPQEEVEKYSKR